MFEGTLWKVTFTSGNDAGCGVISFRDGKVFGGDSGYYYIGSYSLKDAVQFIATVKVKRHTNNVISIFGNVPEFVLKITGNIINAPISFTGNIENNLLYTISGTLTSLEKI